MAIFHIGPDGLLLEQVFIVSVLVAVLAWRRAGLAAGMSAVLAAAVAISIWQALFLSETAKDLRHQIVASSFVIVPSLLLLGVSRLRRLARYAWVFVLLGPIVFVGCYVGICELCVKARLI